MTIIKILSPKSRMTKGVKLASRIASYLAKEEVNGELQFMKESEIEALRKAQKALIRAANRTEG